MRLLVAEDDEGAAAYLIRGLAESGHVVDCVADGETALAMVLEGGYDAVVLDRRLPVLDGLQVLRALRRRDTRTPVLMLSALGSAADRIEGIQAGADDYLVKPYAFAELLARLDALGRRVDRARGQGVLTVGDLELDLQARTARRAGRLIHLQHREFLLLELLMRHAGQVVTRTMLLEAAWPYDFEPRGAIVDMHLHRLRGKVDEASGAPLIHTVRGAGYRLAAAPEAEPGDMNPIS